MKNTFLTITVLLSSIMLHGQADWEADLSKELYEINWIEQAHDGTLIVAGDKATAGVNPETGEVTWVNKDISAMQRGTFSLVDGLPYFVTEEKSFGTGESLLLSNAVDGKPIMSSLDGGFTLMDYTILSELGGILFQTKKDKRYGLSYYDLEQGKILWSADLAKAKGGLGGFLKGQSSFLNDIVVVGDSWIAVTCKNTLYNVDAKTGKVAWTQEYKEDIRKLAVDNETMKLYLGYDKYFDVLDVLSGKSDLGEPIKLRSKFEGIQSAAEGVYVLGGAGFNILNTKTNELRWEKPYKGTAAHQVLKLKKGYAFITKLEDSGVITMLDNEGKKSWTKTVDGQLFYAAGLQKGILYISANRSNVLDYEKGKKVAKKDVKIKGTPAVAFDEADNQLVVFSDKTLSTINLSTGQAKEVATDIKFKRYNDKKDWAEVEVRADGYLAYGSQNAALISKTGKVAFNNHYKPVSTTSAVGALTQMGANVAGVNVNVNSVMTSLDDMDRLANGAYNNAAADGAEVHTKGVASIGIGGSTMLGIVNNRFYASKSDAEYLYIFTQGDDEKQIEKVNKDTGKTVEKIALKDKSPIYHVDSYLQSVTVAEDQKVLKCYKTKD